MTAAEQVRNLAAIAACIAVLGGLAGGYLSRDGWLLLAGSVAGAIAVGTMGVLGTMHLKGLMYSIIGAPIGAVAVYLFLLNRELQVSTFPAAARRRDKTVRNQDSVSCSSGRGEVSEWRKST